MLGGFRPNASGNDAIRKNAGIRFIDGNGIPEFLAQKICKIRAAYFSGQVGKYAISLIERRDREQPRIDALALPRALIVAEEEQPVLLDGTAQSPPKLVLAVEAAFG